MNLVANMLLMIGLTTPVIAMFSLDVGLAIMIGCVLLLIGGAAVDCRRVK